VTVAGKAIKKAACMLNQHQKVCPTIDSMLPIKKQLETIGGENKDQHSAKRFYLPELDTLRFFAFLAVFLVHGFDDPVSRYTDAGVPAIIARAITTVIQAGMFGVDLFFLLSSFLITSLLRREHNATGKIDIRGFWIRRCLRIWPLYFFFVGFAGFLIPRIFHFVPPPENAHVIGLLTFTQNWAIAFSDAGRGSPTLVLWSVSVEEQFYLIWPMLIAFLGLIKLRSIAIWMIAISIIARIYAIHAGASSYMLWLATPFRMEPIAAGAIIALARNQLPAFSSKLRVGMLSLGLAIPVLCSSPLGDSRWAKAVIFPLVAFACTLIFLSIRGSGWRFLKLKPLVYLGKISFGLYVFHQLAIYFSPRLAIPGMPFGRSMAAFALTVVLAALSYRFLELPFLRLKDRFAHIQSRPA